MRRLNFSTDRIPFTPKFHANFQSRRGRVVRRMRVARAGNIVMAQMEVKNGFFFTAASVLLPRAVGNSNAAAAAGPLACWPAGLRRGGSLALRVTSARYLRPDKNSIRSRNSRLARIV